MTLAEFHFDQNGSLPDFTELQKTDLSAEVKEMVDDAKSKITNILSSPTTQSPFARLMQISKLYFDVVYKNSMPQILAMLARDPTKSKTYSEINQMIDEFTSWFFQNQDLHKLCNSINIEKNIPQAEQEKTQRILKYYLISFQERGLSLNLEVQEQLNKARQKLAHWQSEYQGNMLTAGRKLGYKPTEEPLQWCPNTPDRLKELTIIKASQYDAIKYLTSDKQRRELFEMRYGLGSTTVHDQEEVDKSEFELKANPDVRKAILKTAHQVATLLGFTNYASLAMIHRMFNSPKEVLTELQDIVDYLGNKLSGAVDKLEGYLEAGQSIDNTNLDFALTRHEEADSEASKGIEKYFEFNNVLEKGIMEYLIKEKHGYEYEKEKNPHGLWDPDVISYYVKDQSGKKIARILIDPFYRENKANTCMTTGIASRTEETIPTIITFFNFTKNEDGKCFLRPWDIENKLLHEFGHVFNNFTGGSEHPELDGAESIAQLSSDGIEVASSSYQAVRYDPEFIRRIGEHHETGIPIPENLVQIAIQRNIDTEGLRILRQTIRSIVDLKLYSDYPNSGKDLTGFIEDITNEILNYLPPKVAKAVKDDERFHDIGLHHIYINQLYMAGLYAYVIPFIQSQLIAKKLKASNFSPEIFKGLEAKLLSQGAIKSTKELIEAFLGEKIDSQKAIEAWFEK
ncbi:MAG: oligopeptidase A, oligopeptidase A [Candidatus Peregrinibacteria bacterium GW2011_GWF2_33_10]|nr:MAG: oligopeptidase A, oligopeptidase A [Candidatus Peregrinibacteria bacterium GW2011_GWF2_33_10]OGJ44234.1 MAG: hypothetical protein A2263_04640 [Candidatus Peregrinibacteria bacterium RIFOXYA2_FULL_33_21]OGJ47199.1 MAG: hypothetical protein A2272_06340 [Candidatus Peregrinibacteria bacterium RIFOXYA12_FULL_33_12]OGJ49945.1 MAG: hypothetical protein A2307_00815 [Candidatus Peregrinibacteria bacterium RIFOXYB2_FULL_33_20]